MNKLKSNEFGFTRARLWRKENEFRVHSVREHVPWHSRCVVTIEALWIEVRVHSIHKQAIWHSTCVDTIEVVV